MKKGTVFVAIAVVLAAIFFFLAFWIMHNYEVIDKGQLLPYTNGKIYKILVAGQFILYVEPDVKLSGDIVNAALLLGIGFISMTFATVVMRYDGPDVPNYLMFLGLFSAGLIFLAADELLGIHESLGHNMQFLTRIPGIEHPDDAIIAAYGVVALAFLIRFRSILLKMRQPLFYYGAAIVLFLIAAISDIGSLPIEEVAEIGASILILVGTISLGLSILDKVES